MNTTLKALSEGRVGGYLVVWGNPNQKDLTGEYFTPQTELCLDWYDRRPALYHHGLDGVMQTDTIGVIDTVKVDSVGLWAEAQLDMRNRYVQMIQQLIDQGALGWSSGSMAHLVEIDPDGLIKRWPIVEGSMTPTPAEPRHTDIHAIKSAYANLGLALDKLQLPPDDEKAKEATPEEPALKGEVEVTVNVYSDKPDEEEDAAEPCGSEEPTMNVMDCILATLQQVNALLQQNGGQPLDDATMQQLAQQVAAQFQQAAEQPPAEPPAAASIADATMKAVSDMLVKRRAERDAMNAAVANSVKTGFAAMQPQSAVGGFNPTLPTPPVQATGMKDRRFDSGSASDLALGALMLQGVGKTPSEDFLKALAYKTATLVEKGDAAANDLAVKASFRFLKANEVMQTSLSGYGTEYVHPYYSTDVWQQVRQATPIYDAMKSMGMDEKEVPQGYKSDTVPLEGADMTWYNAAGAADEDASSGITTPTYASSKFGTGQTDITLARLSTRTFWQRELEEDSIVDIASEANRKIRVSGTEQIESILINGDTATAATTNINLIDGTPAAAPSKPAYTLLDGLAKLALVTNTANTYNAANTLGETVYLNLLPLLGAQGKYAIDPEKVLFIVDNSTYFASLNLAILKTQDVFPSATVVEGVLRRIWGINLLRSAQFGTALATGKVSGTPANNTFGRILLVRPDQWAARWKRQMEIFVAFDEVNYVTRLAAHMRWGLGYRDNEASAIARNVNVTIA